MQFGFSVTMQCKSSANRLVSLVQFLGICGAASVAIAADQRPTSASDPTQLAAELDAIHAAARQAWRAKQFSEIRDLHGKREQLLRRVDAIDLQAAKGGPKADPTKERLALWQKAYRAVTQARVLTEEVRYHEAARLLTDVIGEWPQENDDSAIYGDLSVQLFLTVQSALYLYPRFLDTISVRADAVASAGEEENERLVVSEAFLREAVARARASDPCQFDAAFILAYLEKPSLENAFLRAENRPELRKRNELLLDAEAVASAGESDSEVTKSSIAWLKAQSSSFVVDDLWYLQNFLAPGRHLMLEAADSSEAILTPTNDLVGYVSTETAAFPTLFIAPQPLARPEPHAVYLFDMDPTKDGKGQTKWPIAFKPSEGKSAVRDQVRELIQTRGSDLATAVERQLGVTRLIDAFRGVPAEKELRSAFESLWAQAAEGGSPPPGPGVDPGNAGRGQQLKEVDEAVAPARRLVERFERFCARVDQNWRNYYQAYPQAEEDVAKRWRDAKAALAQAEALIEREQDQLDGMAKSIIGWRELFVQSVPSNFDPSSAHRSGVPSAGAAIDQDAAEKRRKEILLESVRDLDVVLYQQYRSLQAVADMLAEVRRMRPSPAIHQIASEIDSRLAQEHLLASLDALSVVIRNCSQAALDQLKFIRTITDPVPGSQRQPNVDEVAERFLQQKNSQWRRLADPIERLMGRMNADANAMQKQLNEGEVSANSLGVLLERVRGIDDAMRELAPKGYFDILDQDSIPKAPQADPSAPGAGAPSPIAVDLSTLIPGLGSALASPSTLQRTLLFTQLIRSRLEDAINGVSAATRAEQFCDSQRDRGRAIAGACRAGRLHRAAFPLSTREVGGFLDHLPVIVLRSGRALAELLDGTQKVGGEAIDFERTRIGNDSAYQFARQVEQESKDGAQIGIRLRKVGGLPRQVAVVVVPAARAEREWCDDYIGLIEQKGLLWKAAGVRAAVTVAGDGYQFDFGGLTGTVVSGRADGWRYLRNQHWDYVQPSAEFLEASGGLAPPRPDGMPFRLSRVGASPDDVVEDRALVYQLRDWAQLDDNLVNEFLAEMSFGAPSLSGARLVQREASRPSPIMFFSWPRVSGVATQP